MKMLQELKECHSLIVEPLASTVRDEIFSVISSCHLVAQSILAEKNAPPPKENAVKCTVYEIIQ